MRWSTSFALRSVLAAALLVVGASGLGAEPPQRVRLAHTACSVATSTTECLDAEAARVYALLINDSDTAIYCKVGADAAVNQGVRIDASGGSRTMSPGLYNNSNSAINCIHGGAGTKTLLVTEGLQ